MTYLKECPSNTSIADRDFPLFSKPEAVVVMYEVQIHAAAQASTWCLAADLASIIILQLILPWDTYLVLPLLL